MDDLIMAPSVDLLESLRSVGYSFDAALADIVDNSLAVSSSSIDIDVDVIDGEFVAILDDGNGMDPDATREALRLAGSVGVRGPHDMGRFGLGLKTASLSQARALTVVSRRNGMTTGLRWDIDHIREKRSWSLIVLSESEMRLLPLWDRFQSQQHGTLVVWSKLDLLLGDTPAPGKFLAERLFDLRASLSLVFHRFLRVANDEFSIRVNGLALKPTDPFLATNPKTQVTPTEFLAVGEDVVEVTAYTLPHASGLRAEDRRRTDLSEGMREAQGFYVYRNRRLISHGHWYGLARMSEITKQTRIRVDVPVALDDMWQLDIKKSRAEPPASFRAHLRRIIDPILAKGRRVHEYRGRKESGNEITHVWSKIRDRNGFRYEVNVENSAVQSVLALLSKSDSDRVERLFRTIAESYPFLDVYQELAGNESPFAVDADAAANTELLRAVRDSGLAGRDPKLASVTLRHVEPFNKIADLETLIEQVWGEN